VTIFHQANKGKSVVFITMIHLMMLFCIILSRIRTQDQGCWESGSGSGKRRFSKISGSGSVFYIIHKNIYFDIYIYIYIYIYI
jgi:hypothetical protein